MAAFCSAVNFLRVLVIGILEETGYVSLIRRNSTFKRGKTVSQEVPQPGHPRSGNTNTAKEYGYLSGEIQSSSGYIRVLVGRDKSRVDYVRTYLPAAESQFKRNADVSYSYIVNQASVEH